MRLKGQTAIVTGAASATGRVIAQTMVNEGANVVIVDINKEEVETVARDINESGGRALAIQVDISKGYEVEKMVQMAIAEFGRVDIIVNNASFIDLTNSSKLFSDAHVAEWDPDMDVIFDGTILCCKAIIAYMLKKRRGRIITLIPYVGKTNRPETVYYATCKAILTTFVKALAQELAPYGITVNCISLGPIQTQRTADLSAELPYRQEAWPPPVSVHKLEYPENIANIIVFLASEEAENITGQDYIIDVDLKM